MAWVDKTFCEHGISFADECERCEMVGLEESLKWMKRKVARDEKRLEELDAKCTPEMVRKMRDA